MRKSGIVLAKAMVLSITSLNASEGSNFPVGVHHPVAEDQIRRHIQRIRVSLGEVPFPRLIFRDCLKGPLDVLVVGIMEEIVIPDHSEQALLVEGGLELGVGLPALVVNVRQILGDEVVPLLKIDARLRQHADKEAQDDLRLHPAGVFLNGMLGIPIDREPYQLNENAYLVQHVAADKTIARSVGGIVLNCAFEIGTVKTSIICRFRCRADLRSPRSRE